MKKKNLLLRLLTIMMVTAISVGLVSCGGDDDNNNATEIIDDSGNSSIDYESIIARKVSATATYSDYYWHVTINTNLKSSDVGGREIIYGVDCGYNFIDEEYRMNFDSIYSEFDTSYYKCNYSISSDGKTIKADVPVFVFGKYSSVSNIYNNDQINYVFCLREYDYLTEKQRNGEELSVDEQDTLNMIIGMFNDESIGKRFVSEFWGKLFVSISGVIFYIKSF